jgi:hypothetical protein
MLASHDPFVNLQTLSSTDIEIVIKSLMAVKFDWLHHVVCEFLERLCARYGLPMGQRCSAVIPGSVTFGECAIDIPGKEEDWKCTREANVLPCALS